MRCGGEDRVSDEGDVDLSAVARLMKCRGGERKGGNGASCYLFEMPCFSLTYTHRRGTYGASKWADTPKAALEHLQRDHRTAGLALAVGVGAIRYGVPVLKNPQPFSETPAILHELAA